jgi:hypothetical protein
LVLVYIASAMAITIIFKASVDAQAGAYATGVLAMMASAVIAVTLSARRAGSRLGAVAFGLVTFIFLYGLLANVIDRPDGIMIALYFVGAIILASLVSRVWRTTELRTKKIEVDETAQRFIDAAASSGEEIHIIANMRQTGDVRDYLAKEKEQREHTYIPPDVPILFLEVDVDDPSEFEDVLEIRGYKLAATECCAPRARRFRMPSTPSFYTCTTRIAKRCTATSIGRRAVRSCTYSAMFC